MIDLFDVPVVPGEESYSEGDVDGEEEEDRYGEADDLVVREV